jgi:hypothetical protein
MTLPQFVRWEPWSCKRRLLVQHSDPTFRPSCLGTLECERQRVLLYEFDIAQSKPMAVLDLDIVLGFEPFVPPVRVAEAGCEQFACFVVVVAVAVDAWPFYRRDCW